MTDNSTPQPPSDDLAVQVLSDEGAQCGDCSDQPGDRICPACEKCRRDYVLALRAAGWGPTAALIAEVQRLHVDLDRLKGALAAAAVHCPTEYGGPGYTHCELVAGHDGEHESALGHLARATWGGAS